MTSSNNKSKTENVALGRIDLSERKKAGCLSGSSGQAF